MNFNVLILMKEIFAAGFIEGFFLGISIKTGIDASETGISLLLLKGICDVVSGYAQTGLLCFLSQLFVGLLGFLGIIGGILLFRSDNIKGAIFFAGMFIGAVILFI